MMEKRNIRITDYKIIEDTLEKLKIIIDKADLSYIEIQGVLRVMQEDYFVATLDDEED